MIVSTLLAYVIVVCNVDFDRIRKKRTSLTWFEEWFLYFEWKYHATNLCQQHMEAAWGIDKRFINQVKDCKAALEVALQSWTLLWKLWTGAVEDGTNHSKSGYIQAQKEFQEADLVALMGKLLSSTISWIEGTEAM